MKDREDTGGVVLTGDVGATNSDGDGRTIIQVECGLNKAVLHLDKLCQGSKGACVLFDDAWVTPNEFQAASGRELAKDWKRSIKHHDKSLKLLISKGFLFLDPAACRCEHCAPSSSSPSTESPSIRTSSSETKIPKETKKRPAKTELPKRAKKQKVNNVRTNKSTSAGTTKSTSAGTTKSTSAGTTKSGRNNKSSNVGTNKSANVGSYKSAKVGTNKSANLDIIESANVVTNKSANPGTNKSVKASKTNTHGKQPKAPARQRKPETGRKGKRVTTTKTKNKRAIRSLGKKRTKKAVNGTTAITSEEFNSEQREHVEDDNELSEDNSEDNAPLADSEYCPKENGTAEENGEGTDSASIESTRSYEQLTQHKTEPSPGGDSDIHDMEHESNVHAPTRIETGPNQLDNGMNSATEAGNESTSGSERSCTPLSNYIANKSGKCCKIIIKKTSNGFLPGDNRGAISPQQGQSGDCSEKAKTRKSVVSQSTEMTAIASGAVVDCKTDGSTVDNDGVSHTKSDTHTDVVSDSEVCSTTASTLSDVVSVYRTNKTVVGRASCCKTDSFTEIYDVRSSRNIDSDTDVHDVASSREADVVVVNDAMSACETGGSVELIIPEPEHNRGCEPETNAATPVKTDVSVVSTEEASSNAPELTFSSHSKHTDSNSLSAGENDQSFTKLGRENREIDTADTSASELLIEYADDDTEVLNNNVTSPAVPGESISPKREARLLNIIQELKTYKKQLSAKIDETKRHVDFNVSPLHDILQNDKTSMRVQPGYAQPESRSSPGVRDINSEPPSSNCETPTFVRKLPATSFARDLMNATPRRTKTGRKESAIIRQLTGSTVGHARTQAWVNENGATIYYTAQSNGGGSLATIPFSTYGADSHATVANQVVHADSIPRSRYNDNMTSDTIVNSGKCLLKIPKRYSDNVSFPLRNGCDDAPSALIADVRKRKSATPRTHSVSKKQRCSWPLNKTDAASCLLDLTKCIASNAAAKTNINASYDSAPSLCVGHLTETSTRGVQVASLTRPVRRSHISSWTADDVYSFVLSSPHAAIYAKDFLELRITGRVLQNLTAIQMMRILRIGELAARAVRTAVEKALLTSSAARNQSIRR